MRKQLGRARAVPKNKGVKTEEMTGYSINNNLHPEFIGLPGSQAEETKSRISRSIRRNAESVYSSSEDEELLRRQSSTVEVGDGHSSDLKDGETNISSPEPRAVSLNEQQ